MPDSNRDPMPGPPSGRTRILEGLRSPLSRGQLIAAGLLAVLGFGAVVQVRSNETNDSYVGARQGDLVSLINNLSLATQRTEAQISQLQRTRQALQSDTRSKQTAMARANQQIVELGILAGTLIATGPGVRIVVTDPNKAIGTDQLLNGIEELRDAGAEAMELNDRVRLVAQSWVEDDAQGGVLVDGVHLSPPYVIDAIGDSHTLATAVNFNGGFASEVTQQGGTIRVRQSAQIEVTKVVKPKTPLYAVPTQKR